MSTKQHCPYCGDNYYHHCSCMQPEYEEYEGEPTCDYGGDFCIITYANMKIEEFHKGVINKTKNKFSKKRKEELESHYQTAALIATEHCSFHCELRPRGDD